LVNTLLYQKTLKCKVPLYIYTLSKIKKLLKSEASANYFRYRPDEVLFLNFNYTSTEIHYHTPPIDKEFENDIAIDVIHIHGILNNKMDNKILLHHAGNILLMHLNWSLNFKT